MYELDVVIYYLFAVNVIGFISMGIDKRKAKKNVWRVPENTLWLIAIVGGAVGSWSGMKKFRHKTKHRSFVIGMPILILIHIFLLVYLIDIDILS